MRLILRNILTITLLITFKIGGNLNAQNNIDSLKYNLKIAKVDSAKAEALYYMANYYLDHNDLRSLEYFNKSKALYTEMKDTINIFFCLVMLSDVYINNCEYKKAFNILNEALPLAKNNEAFGLYYNRLSLVYNDLGETYKSMLNDKIALKYYQLQNDSSAMSVAFHNIGDYYYNNDILDSAQLFINKSIEYCHDTSLIKNAYNVGLLAQIERKKGNYSKAIMLNKRTSQIFSASGLWYETANEKYNLAYCYMDMNMPDSAIFYNLQAIDISKKINNYELLKRNYDLLYKLYERKTDYKNALKYAVLKNVCSDSIEAKNKDNIIQKFEIKDKLLKQDEALLLTQSLNRHLEKQRRLLISFSFVVFIFFIFALYSLIQKRKEQKKNILLLDELNIANNNQRTILSIIGHDLKESIGTLKTFIQFMHLKLLDKKSITDLVQDFVPMVESSSDLLDNLLTWAKNNNENFKPNLQEVFSNEIIDRTIIHVQHIARTKNIVLKVEGEEISFIADANMMNTVLRNLITNAIKFSEVNSEIKIKSCKKDSYIEFSVTDHGVGMTEEQIEKIFDESLHFHTNGTLGEKGSGLGLSLCNSFIDKQNGKLSVVSKKNEGSTFTFSIPLKTNLQIGSRVNGEKNKDFTA